MKLSYQVKPPYHPWDYGLKMKRPHDDEERPMTLGHLSKSQ